jgi:hypothetical protein
VTLGALDADFKSINASGLTAGGVSATLSATTTATFTGGAGADRLTTSTSGQTGAVDAGAGTDTLILANSVDIDTTAKGALYKGFETLAVANAVSIDMDLLTGSTITAVAVVPAPPTVASGRSSVPVWLGKYHQSSQDFPQVSNSIMTIPESSFCHISNDSPLLLRLSRLLQGRLCIGSH